MPKIIKILDDTWYQFFNFQAILSNPYLKHKNLLILHIHIIKYIYKTSDAIHLQCFVQLQHSCFPACHGTCCSCICSRTHSIAQFQACSRTAKEGIQDITVGNETTLTSGVGGKPFQEAITGAQRGLGRFRTKPNPPTKW